MAKVFLICGKICSGKGFYTRQLKEKEHAVVLSCDEIENDLGDYILKNKNLPTTDNDRWINGEIDLAKYSLGTDKVASVTEHMDELKSMIE